MKKIVLTVLVAMMFCFMRVDSWAYDGPDVPGKYIFRSEEEKDPLNTICQWSVIGYGLVKGFGTLGNSQKLVVEKLRLEQEHEIRKMKLEEELWERRQLFMKQYGIKAQDSQPDNYQFLPAVYQPQPDTETVIVPINY